MSIQRMALVTFCAMLAMGQTAPEQDAAGASSGDAEQSDESADEEPQLSVEDVLAAAEALYGPPPEEPEVPFACDRPQGDEIVVCAPLEEQSQFRVTSRMDRGDNSNLTWEGDPPDVSGPGIFKGPATASGCIKGLTCPPPPAYIFDITALPESPPGSDADRIAKGEMPEP